MSEVCERIRVLLSWKPRVRHWPLQRHSWTRAACVGHKSSHVALQQHCRHALHKRHRSVTSNRELLVALRRTNCRLYLSLRRDVALWPCAFRGGTLPKRSTTSSDTRCSLEMVAEVPWKHFSPFGFTGCDARGCVNFFFFWTNGGREKNLMTIIDGKQSVHGKLICKVCTLFLKFLMRNEGRRGFVHQVWCEQHHLLTRVFFFKISEPSNKIETKQNL